MYTHTRFNPGDHLYIYIYIYPIQYSASSRIPTQHWFEPAIKGGVIMGWGACSCERKGMELCQTWSQNWPLIFLHENIHHNMCPIWCGVWFEHHTLGLWFWSAIKVICKVILSLIQALVWPTNSYLIVAKKWAKLGTINETGCQLTRFAGIFCCCCDKSLD